MATSRTELDYDYSNGDDVDEATRDESWVVRLEQHEHNSHLPGGGGGSQEGCPPIDRTKRARNGRLPQVLLELLRCFSLRKNLKQIGKQVPTAATNTTEAADDQQQQRQQQSTAAPPVEDIKVIHGLRTITMIWIIFGHTIGLVNPEMMSKY